MRGKHAKKAARRRQRQAAEQAERDREAQAELRCRLAKAQELEAESTARLLRLGDALDAIRPADQALSQAVLEADNAEARAKDVKRELNHFGRAFWRDWDAILVGQMGGQKGVVIGTRDQVDLIEELVKADLMHPSQMTDRPTPRFQSSEAQS